MSKNYLTPEEMLEQWPELADEELTFEVGPLVPVVSSVLSPERTSPQLPPLCKDCHWVSIPYARELENHRCFAKENCAGTNLVNGDPVYYFPQCIQQRDGRNNHPSACGVSGKWFKKRELPAIQEVIVHPTIGGKMPTNLELVVTKPKVGSLKRLTKEDLENI